MAKFEPLQKVDNDNLIIDDVRSWSKEKYRLVGTYCDIFSTGMKNVWNELIYIDLFSGSGYAKIKNTRNIYKNSALIALSVPNIFTKYIFCEKDSDKCNALRERVKRDFPHRNSTIIEGDCNDKIDEIYNAIPNHSRQNKVLTFCFADPYSLDFNYSTISTLGKNKLVDFLILQALDMDGRRNFEIYYKKNNDRIARYLGNNEWRDNYNGKSNSDFVKFLADEYQNQMHSMGYHNKKLMHKIISDDKKLSLYYLAFYSKSERGIDFFNKVKKRIKPQIALELNI